MPSRRWGKRLHPAALRKRDPLGADQNADFRRIIDPLLDQFCAEVGLNPLVRVEYTLANGRADAVFNRLVIEYERPGVLKKTPIRLDGRVLYKLLERVRSCTCKAEGIRYRHKPPVVFRAWA